MESYVKGHDKINLAWYDVSMTQEPFTISLPYTNHYWGADAIMKRVDVRSSTQLRKLIVVDRLPVIKRWVRRPPRRAVRMLYTNDMMILAWELALAQRYHDELYADKPLPKYLQDVCRPLTKRVPRDIRPPQTQ
jgi:hypothetical protein